MTDSSSQQYWSTVDIFIALGSLSLGEDPAEDLRNGCDQLIASQKCSQLHVKSVLEPIRNAVNPLSRYRAGLKTIHLSRKYRAVH